MYLNDWAMRMWGLWTVTQAVVISCVAVVAAAGVRCWVKNRESDKEWGEPVE